MRTVALVLANLGCIAALIWMFDVPYRQFRIDLLRYHLFGVRDCLFEAAEKGKISFNSAGYGMVRQTLNGMIRFAHQLSFWQVLLMILTHRFWLDPGSEIKFSERYESSMRELTAEQRNILDDIMSSAHSALVSHLAHTSLLLFPFVVISKGIGRAFGLFNFFVKKTDTSLPKPVLTLVDSQAYAIGAPEPPLARAA